MLMEKGWIKLERSIMQLINNPTALQIYIYLATNADYISGKITTTIPSISHATGLSIQGVRTAINRLIKASIIKKVETTNKNTTFAIQKFCIFQHSKNKINTNDNNMLQNINQKSNRQSKKLTAKSTGKIDENQQTDLIEKNNNNSILSLSDVKNQQTKLIKKNRQTNMLFNKKVKVKNNIENTYNSDAPSTADSITTPQTQSNQPKSEPILNQKRKSSSGSYQVQAQEIQEIVEMYISKTGCLKQGASQAIRNITKFLERGVTKEELIKSITNYSRYIIKNNIEQQYIIRVYNFFGKKEVWRDWIDVYVDSFSGSSSGSEDDEIARTQAKILSVMAEFGLAEEFEEYQKFINCSKQNQA